MPTSRCSVNGSSMDGRACDDTKESVRRGKGGKGQVTRRLGFAGQTGDTGSAARRESARKNEREGAGAGAGGSSGVDSRAGVPVSPVAVAGVTATAGVNGWSTVDVEMRFPSLPPSIEGGVVVIRNRDV